MSVASPELLLSPSLLSASPELSTLLPLEEEINTVHYLPTETAGGSGGSHAKFECYRSFLLSKPAAFQPTG